MCAIPFAARIGSRAALWPHCLRSAGIAKARIDGLCFSSFTLGPDTAVGLTQHLGLAPRWLDNIPMGGASGIVALRRAARAVQCGDAEIVACIAADTNHPDTFRRTLGEFQRVRAAMPSIPMAPAAPMRASRCSPPITCAAIGARAEDFGKICVAQRANALSFPHALLRKPLTLEEYLAARPIADPMRLFDCVMPCAGAEGLLVMRREIAAELGLRHARMLATIERHNAFRDDPDAVPRRLGAGPRRALCPGRHRRRRHRLRRDL